MGSESMFTKCKACGKEISKSAKACPQCGAKNKKLTLVHWLGIGFLALIVIGVINSPDNESQLDQSSSEESESPSKEETVESKMPDEQARFVKAVTESVKGRDDHQNELQQSALRDQRMEAISTALNDRSIKSWVGTINQLETNNEGKAILSIKISPDIEIKTWNNAFSDIASNTLIDKDESVYKSVFDLSTGDQVRFSGNFFPSESDYIQETSVTIDGSMRNPEFLFKFRSVKPMK